jgi:hypothetical protein
VERLIQTLLAVIISLGVSMQLFASGCALPVMEVGDTPEQYIARIGRGWIGDSELVVRARVTSLGSSYSNEYHRYVIATLKVEKTYVGDKRESLKAFVNQGVVVGQELIVYARRENEEQSAQRKKFERAWNPPIAGGKTIDLDTTDVLAADGNCSDTAVPSTKKEFASHVAFLEKLPLPNSGGELEIVCLTHGVTYFDWGRVSCPVRLAKGGRLIGDDQPREVHKFSQLSSGTYRLITTPRAGTSVTCNARGSNVSCDAIAVVDLGTRTYGVAYKNAGTVDLFFRDSMGDLASYPVLVRFTSLTGSIAFTGQSEKSNNIDAVLRYMGHSDGGSATSTSSHRAWLPPGRYRFEYALPTSGKRPTTAGQYDQRRSFGVFQSSPQQTELVVVSGRNSLTVNLSK